jgi:hypothetical protein
MTPAESTESALAATRPSQTPESRRWPRTVGRVRPRRSATGSARPYGGRREGSG